MLGRSLHLPFDYIGQDAGDQIRLLLESGKPCMVCRFGSLELSVAVAYLNQTRLHGLKRLWRLSWGESISWDATLRYKICNIAGFFPPEPEQLVKFAQLLLEDSKQIDILGSWRPEEFRVNDHFPDATIIKIDDLEPYFHARPWTEALRGRKVLVIHPFTDTIKQQYQKRELLFENKDVLPDFELKTITAVQSLAGNKVEYKTWFDALDYMCGEIDKTDFDIALIGAGAYGFPLAAHVKRSGKQAVHLGGISQLLFGIKGRRWDQHQRYRDLYNDSWCRPNPQETPSRRDVVEGGSYW